MQLIPENKVSLPEPDRRTRAKRISLSLLFILLLLLITDTGTLEKIPRLCLWYRLSGTDCPFCGLIRSCSAFASGQFSRSLDYHPFGPGVFLFIITLFSGFLYNWISGKPPRWLSWFERNLVKISLVAAIPWLSWWLWKLFRTF